MVWEIMDKIKEVNKSNFDVLAYFFYIKDLRYLFWQ